MGAARQGHRLSLITEMRGTVSGTGEECCVFEFTVPAKVVS